MAGAGLTTSLLTGDPKYAMAVAGGYGMRRASNALMRNRAEMLGRMTASRSPLATSMGAGGPAIPFNTDVAQGGLLGMLPSMGGGQPSQPQFAGPQQTPFEQAVAADLRKQFPNETPEQIDQRVQSVSGQMTSGQTFLPEVQGGLRINQPNWERFLAAQPRSRNIEDRRTRP